MQSKNAIQHEAVIKLPYTRWAGATPPKKGPKNAHSASGISFRAKTAAYPKAIFGSYPAVVVNLFCLQNPDFLGKPP